MEAFKHTLSSNARVLKSKASKQAVFGLVVGIAAVLIATMIVSYTMTGAISIDGIIQAQKKNIAIWFLDVSPFFFSFWGQYINSIIAYEASAMILDETRDLRMQTSALQTQATHDMTHDSLTDLPNNVLFLDRLNQALSNHRRDKHQLAICMITVRNLKEVNNSFGRYNGDRILKQFAVRLASIIQEPHTIARLGNDEFAALLLKLNSSKDAIELMKKIHKALKIPFVLEDLSLNIQVNIGIALSPEHGVDSDTLLQRAEIATEAAQQEFEDIKLYNSELDKGSQHRLILVSELREALEHDGLQLYYQPKYNFKTNKCSFEALIRWPHPKYGMIMPDDFIPLVERNGMASALSGWVINEVLHQCVAWQTQGLDISFAVNLSALNLVDLELPDKVAGKFAKFAVPPGSLILEITESAIMRDQERALQILNRLVELGAQISIDDFGTGYSSLGYLSKLPASELKIDKSFVIGMKDESNVMIVQAIIGLAHNLHLKVVAEGVESETTLMRLKEWGCDSVQGTFISPPLSAENALQWIQTSRWCEGNR